MHAATFNNSYGTVVPWLRSTGFRTHSLRLKDLGGPGSAREIGDEFLALTRFRREDRETEASIQAYFADPGTMMLSRNNDEDLGGLRRVPLPDGARLRRELGDLLIGRRSTREYTGDRIGIDQLASLLRAGGAVSGRAHVDLLAGGEAEILFRTAPSPGGLYPIDIFVLALRVDNLERGVWRYNARTDSLIHEGDTASMMEAMGAFTVPEEIISLSQAAAVLLLIARPWKVMRKYGPRGVRYLFIEAGAITENVHLACGSLGVGSVDCASVADDELHDALGLDGEMECLAHAVVLGVPG
jgi:SagB-type dehydrogenase family enzyme